MGKVGMGRTIFDSGVRQDAVETCFLQASRVGGGPEGRVSTGALIGLLAVVMVGLGCEPIPNEENPNAVAQDTVEVSSLEEQGATDAASTNSTDSQSDEAAQGAPEQPQQQGPTARADNGFECTDDAQCDSLACVDGFCCESECDGVCVACGISGSEGACVPTESDSACPDLQCPAATECLGYDESQRANNCAGARSCRETAACVAVATAAGTACAGGEGTCDGQGVCVVPDKASLGEGCSADGDCAEGHCVEGPNGANVCCDSACDGVCQACGANGRCDATPAVDARCEPASCPADNVCRNYPQLTAGQCGSFGVCEGEEACFAQAQELRPDAQCDCGADGSCALVSGVICQSDAECGQRTCEQTSSGANVCCTESCGGDLFCARDGSRCVECEGDAVSCDGNRESRCVNGRQVVLDCPNGCSEGRGCNERAPVGFSCAAAQCQQGAVCQQDTSGAQRCCSRSCPAEGKVCGTDGSCQCPPGQLAAEDSCLRQLGDPCEAGEQCQGGRCVDGVCCSEPCDGFCEQCEPISGACLALPVGAPDNSPQTQCANTHECNGSRDGCQAKLGVACSQNEGCRSNSCVDTGDGAEVCCEERCAADEFCTADGTRCVECFGLEVSCNGNQAERCVDGSVVTELCGNGCRQGFGCEALLEDGQPCGLDFQCASGRCVEHYRDADRDGFAPSSALDFPIVLCVSDGFPVPADLTRVRPTGPDTTDCLDSSATVFPTQGRFFDTARVDSILTGNPSFDYNCDGEETPEFVVGPEICGDQDCAAGTTFIHPTFNDSLPVSCGETGVVTFTCGFRVFQGETLCAVDVTGFDDTNECH